MIRFYPGALFLLLTLLMLTPVRPGWAQRVEMTVNPYEGVDWSTVQQFKANFHTHTQVSDGDFTPHQAVDQYHGAGYHILALTDHIPSWDGNNPHNIVTWPWTNFSGLTRAVRHNASWQDRDPEELGMLAVAGSESSEGHHRGSLFSLVSDPSSDYDASFALVADSGGLAMWYHPGRYWSVHNTYSPGQRYSPEWYVDYHQRFDVLIGMEVYNQGNRHREDRVLWDEVLLRSMPDLPVWGFSNDDMHSRDQLFRNYQFMLMDTLSEGALRHAMTSGQLFFSYEPEGSGEAKAPRIDSVTVDEESRRITIHGRNYDSIEWISGVTGLGGGRQSRIIGTSETFHWDSFYDPYVRAALENDYGRTYTQPFGFYVRTLHVSANGDDQNDGSSWEKAFATLDHAMEQALEGDMIWVSKGTYTPQTDHLGHSNPSDQRTRSFQLTKNLVIFGGFDGSETSLVERDFTTNETILSGDFGDGTYAYHVFYHNDDSEVSVGGLLDGFTITGGRADGSYPHNSGGGMYNHGASPTLRNVTFYDNQARTGGAIYNTSDSEPDITFSSFISNSADTDGGAVFSRDSSPRISHSQFQGNSGRRGGALFNHKSSLWVGTSVFHGNSAETGGALYNDAGSPELIHVTAVGNTAGEGGAIYSMNDSSPRIVNSIFWNNDDDGGTGVAHEAGSRPHFSYSLLQGSGGSARWLAAAGTDGGNNIDSDPQFVLVGEHPLLIYGTSPATDAADPDAADPDDLESQTDIRGQSRPAGFPGSFPDMGAYEFQAGIDMYTSLPLHIHPSGSDSHDGLSWSTAFKSLDHALQIAGQGDTLWMAAGTYHPTRIVADDDVEEDVWRAFRLRNHVVIYGGFEGTERRLSERDHRKHETILSGELAPGRHVYNVFFHSELLRIDSTAVLDGVTITGGLADGLPPRNAGAGMQNIEANPTLRNVTFRGNTAAFGGGMYNRNGSAPYLVHCIFRENSALQGGGMYNRNLSHPVIHNTKFLGNEAEEEGGGLFNSRSNPVLINVLMSGNIADQGGGVVNYLGSEPAFLNVTISGNLANDSGGGMANTWESHARIENSIIWGNIATRSGNRGNEIFNDLFSSAQIGYSLFGNGQNDVAAGGGADGGDHSLHADPEFTEPVDAQEAPFVHGDYRLMPESPAIDAGNNQALWSVMDSLAGWSAATGYNDRASLTDLAGQTAMNGHTSRSNMIGLAGRSATTGYNGRVALTDLAGRLRIVDGNSDGREVIDMGAYEFHVDSKPSGSDDPDSERPYIFRLDQNYPNPFNPSTQIDFELPATGMVELIVYDALGRRVAVLADREMPAGSHQVRFDASGLASGVYIYRLQAGGRELTRKMVFVK